MNPYLERAKVLLGQSQFALAEQELRQALSQEPDSDEGHVHLAACLWHRGCISEALIEARRAIELAPELPYGHFVLGALLLDAKRLDEAEVEFRRALRLEPDQPDCLALYALLCLERRNWTHALTSAEMGLKLDSKHIECGNMRALALLRLGDRESASKTMRDFLELAPENADLHASQGCILTDQGEHERAVGHFREALRLDPTSNRAREGILEAMKGRYVLYRPLMAYSQWIGRIDQRMRRRLLMWMIGGYVLFMLTLEAIPLWGLWVLNSVLGLALIIWLTQPLFDLALSLNRFGRILLSSEQRFAARAVGVFFLCALICLCAYLSTSDQGFLVAAMAWMLAVFPIKSTRSCTRPGTRSGGLVLAILGAVVALAISVPLIARMLIPAWTPNIALQIAFLCNSNFTWLVVAELLGTVALVLWGQRSQVVV